jgi:hypothetical protein
MFAMLVVQWYGGGTGCGGGGRVFVLLEGKLLLRLLQPGLPSS